MCNATCILPHAHGGVCVHVCMAQEKRALMMFNYEEKQKRESQILADFRSLVQTKLGDHA